MIALSDVAAMLDELRDDLRRRARAALDKRFEVSWSTRVSRRMARGQALTEAARDIERCAAFVAGYALDEPALEVRALEHASCTPLPYCEACERGLVHAHNDYELYETEHGEPLYRLTEEGEKRRALRIEHAEQRAGAARVTAQQTDTKYSGNIPAAQARRDAHRAVTNAEQDAALGVGMVPAASVEALAATYDAKAANMRQRIEREKDMWKASVLGYWHGYANDAEATAAGIRALLPPAPKKEPR